MRVAGVVLAAGRASRFGAPKVLATVPGVDGSDVAMIRRVVDVLANAGVGPMIVVAGAETDAVSDAVSGASATVVHCPGHAAGMSASLRCGVEALRALPTPWDALLVALGDQPTIGARAVQAVTARFAASLSAGRDVAIVVPSYRGTRGHPVLFARSACGALMQITGDRGARAVVARNEARVVEAAIDAEVPPDVDSPEDLVRVRAMLAVR